jgi:hypothetical protein
MAVFAPIMAMRRIIRPVTVAYADHTYDATNLTTYTFSARALGGGAKKNVLAIGGGSLSRTISSVTVDGGAANYIDSMVWATPEGTLEFWQIDGVSATTGDIVVTWSGGQLRCSIGVFAVYNAAALASDTPSVATASGNPSVSVSVPANGAAIGAVINNACPFLARPWQ